MFESAYDLDKPAILDVLEHLLHNKAFALQGEAVFQRALAAYRTSDADFADCLIHGECEFAECQLVTFDKRLAKRPGVTLIKQ